MFFSYFNKFIQHSKEVTSVFKTTLVSVLIRYYLYILNSYSRGHIKRGGKCIVVFVFLICPLVFCPGCIEVHEGSASQVGNEFLNGRFDTGHEYNKPFEVKPVKNLLFLKFGQDGKEAFMKISQGLGEPVLVASHGRETLLNKYNDQSYHKATTNGDESCYIKTFWHFFLPLIFGDAIVLLIIITYLRFIVYR